MEILSGKSVSGGISIGRFYYYSNQSIIEKRIVHDITAEIQRFEDSRIKAMEQLDGLYKEAVMDIGEEHAMIMDVQRMMLEDYDYRESILERIKNEGINAEYAVLLTGEQFSELFSNMEDDYMKGRAADVLDISNRLIDILSKRVDKKLEFKEAVIIGAYDMAPSETIQLDKKMVMALVTSKGTVSSHTAILAKNMGIPSIVSVEGELKSLDGKLVIVDGYSGNIYIEPDETILKDMREKQDEDLKKSMLLTELKGKDSSTKDGKFINIFSNIGNEEEVIQVIEQDAEGVGLFRSEFLYLNKERYPTEEELFSSYKKVAIAMGDKKVIIRTLDIGADKNATYFKLAKEENPALGLRGIRICLTRSGLFKTQLRAIYRASNFGNLSIMFPMIISVDEVLEIKELIKEVKEELSSELLDYKDIEIGIMIETPAAAILSDLLAKEVDFFSIGTNDLTQYTLAIDRQNESLDKFYNPNHLALLRLISLTVKNAHANGIWVGICGELASDLELTELFLRMGMDELSVSSSMILTLREKVRSLDLRQEPLKEIKELENLLWS